MKISKIVQQLKFHPKLMVTIRVDLYIKIKMQGSGRKKAAEGEEPKLKY